MDAVSAHEVKDARKAMTEAEKIVWSHAYWARLNHENAQFIPTQARQCAIEVLNHAREFGVVEAMAAELGNAPKAEAPKSVIETPVKVAPIRALEPPKPPRAELFKEPNNG